MSKIKLIKLSKKSYLFWYIGSITEINSFIINEINSLNQTISRVAVQFNKSNEKSIYWAIISNSITLC